MNKEKVFYKLFWAIVVLTSLTLMTLMVGCSSREKQKEVNVYDIDSLKHLDYSIYIIDSCEYIVYYSGSSSWGSHKGNCKNPIHGNH